MSDPALHRVVLWICDLCLDGKGGECHVPGCTLWMCAAPDVPIRDRCNLSAAPSNDDDRSGLTASAPKGAGS